MEIITGFLVGIGTGVFITWFPGMLNMQVVDIAVRAGKPKAYLFSAGMAAVIGAQTTLAVLFANLLTANPSVVPAIKQWAIPLFLVLALVFVWKGFRARAARKAEVERPHKGGLFWRGMIMSSMNILNIPLVFAIAGFLMADGYLSRAFLPRLAYVPGTTLGTLLIFVLYGRLSGWLTATWHCLPVISISLSVEFLLYWPQYRRYGCIDAEWRGLVLKGFLQFRPKLSNRVSAPPYARLSIYYI